MVRRQTPAERGARLQLLYHFQTAGLISWMLLLAGLMAQLSVGPYWLPLLAGLVALSTFKTPQLKAVSLARESEVAPLHPGEAPQVCAVLETLSRRGGLPRVPYLYRVPGRIPNAFTMGDARGAAIALTEGLLQVLTPRELAGVLAHELAHLRSGDARTTLLAEIVLHLTVVFAALGALSAVGNSLLALGGVTESSYSAIVPLLFLPTLSAILQFSLFRSREFAADLDAAQLTGDPSALASALRKIGRFEEDPIESTKVRHCCGPNSVWWWTHPATEERVRALLELTPPLEPD